ncbi:MAG TPA: asparaginase [Deinococcales bacterium]|nr:asparaginase [Deinococcales bacterium]
MSFVELWRGGVVESRHRVNAAVVRPDGSLLAFVGDPGLVTFLRSSAKPFQAQPLVSVMEKFGLEDRHLAIAGASHNGEAVHRETVLDLQARSGVSLDWLVCGTHQPFDAATRAELALRGERPSVLYHNCSGKHSGMLAACLGHGWPTEGYEHPHHPLQLEIARVLAGVSGVTATEAVDGCSVPTFALPLTAGALAFARLADPSGAPEEFRVGLGRAFDAMTGNPYLVAGRERFDTTAMEATPGLLAKGGAEGFQGVAVRDTRFGPLGIALKIEDGGERARDAAVTRVLAGLGVVSESEEPYRNIAEVTLRNYAGLTVGAMRAGFDLRFA